MRVHLITCLILIAAACFAPVGAWAVDRPKSDAYKAYTEEVATTAIHAVRTQLEKRSEKPPSDISLNFAFQVDPAGHVHDVKVTAKKSNPSAEEIARRVLINLKLPRFPKKVADEVGNTTIDITTPS